MMMSTYYYDYLLLNTVHNKTTKKITSIRFHKNCNLHFNFLFTDATVGYGDCVPTTVRVSNCNETSHLNTLCGQECENQDECRCLRIPNVPCDNAACLFPTCVPKMPNNNNETDS